MVDGDLSGTHKVKIFLFQFIIRMSVNVVNKSNYFVEQPRVRFFFHFCLHIFVRKNVTRINNHLFIDNNTLQIFQSKTDNFHTYIWFQVFHSIM